MNPSLGMRCACELSGTALLVGVGTGAIVAASRAGGIPAWIMALPWFLAVLLPILLFVRVSGAHLNPVVTTALAVSGRIAWGEVPYYMLAQLAGAFIGSGAVWGLLGGGAHLGSTTPTHVDLAVAFVGEFVFTALLVIAVFALSDLGEGRRRWRLTLPPLAVALSTLVIGPWTGSSLNPARTLAPAILSGTYTDLWLYLIAVPLGSLAVAAVWRPRAVDIFDRGPGRADVSR